MVNKKNKDNMMNGVKFSPKEKILRNLIENKDSKSIRSISGSTLVNYKNAYNIVSDLYPKLVSKRKMGNTTMVKLNLMPNQEIYSVEGKRKEEFLSKHPKLRIVGRYVEELDYPFLILLVFGSYVKNSNHTNSDIDICIISDNKNKTKELFEKLNILSLKLELHEFTTEEFISMIEKSRDNLGNEIVKNNVILYGIENYYHLISKWMKKE